MGVKRLNLELDDKFYEQIKTVAEQEGTTVVAMIRYLIKVGLYVKKNPEKLNAVIIS